MEPATLSVVPCPTERREEALSLVLCDVAPSLRGEIAASLLNADAGAAASHGLYVAIRGEHVCGAVWVQPQSGKTAVLWPPQLTLSENAQTAYQLAKFAVHELDRLEVSMAQVLLPPGESAAVPVLATVGFRHLADLMYLSCEAHHFRSAPGQSELSFAPVEESECARFAQLVEQTYENTLDCAELNGVRSMEDVLDGYRATGAFRIENWLIACAAGHDVGVLLLADHPQANHWELVYMGLVPAARGRGWGRHIVRHAKRLAQDAGVERIVLAVDSVNEPALRMYHSEGFEAWDRRAVYVRVCR